VAIEKKLGVWGKDRSEGKVFAKDYYCVKCYEKEKKVPAVVFYPYSDADISFFPYCRPCVDKEKLMVLMKMNEDL